MHGDWLMTGRSVAPWRSARPAHSPAPRANAPPRAKFSFRGSRKTGTQRAGHGSAPLRRQADVPAPRANAVTAPLCAGAAAFGDARGARRGAGRGFGLSSVIKLTPETPLKLTPVLHGLVAGLGGAQEPGALLLT